MCGILMQLVKEKRSPANKVFSLHKFTFLSFPEPTLAFAVPRTFFCLFFLSLRCFLPDFFSSSRPCLASLYLGSQRLAFSRVSQMRPKPVVLPPPNCVRKPKQKMTSGVVLYMRASFSRTSVLGTVALPGWSTSTTICFLLSRRLVRNFRVRIVAAPSLCNTFPDS